MWIEDSEDSEEEFENCSANEDTEDGEEIPIWVCGTRRWVSGIVRETTCQDVIEVLIQDEEARGKHPGSLKQYHITEWWRGVEKHLPSKSSILDIWNKWGKAQSEVQLTLRSTRGDGKKCSHVPDTLGKNIRTTRRKRSQNEKYPSRTETLLKLVLEQGESIRKQLIKLRLNECQTGLLGQSDVRGERGKNGRNYILETYLDRLPDAEDPEKCFEDATADKRSDSGVATEGECETEKQLLPGSTARSSQNVLGLLRSSEDSEDPEETANETLTREKLELFEMIFLVNKQLLRQEKCLHALNASIGKCEAIELAEKIEDVMCETAKSSCEMQHNEMVLEQSRETLRSRRVYLEHLHMDLINEEKEFEAMQVLFLTNNPQRDQDLNMYYMCNSPSAKELSSTLV